MSEQEKKEQWVVVVFDWGPCGEKDIQYVVGPMSCEEAMKMDYGYSGAYSTDHVQMKGEIE